MRFLEQLADEVYRDHANDLQSVAVVLPSRRAGLFFRKFLSDRIGKAYFPPHIISINELIEQIAVDKPAESPELVFLLYQAYCKVSGPAAEPYERFSKWGNILLSDFNEVDRYMVDPKKIFSDLRNIKAQELEIESWSFEGKGLSDNQTRYLEFWNGLLEYYTTFNTILTEKGVAYQGRIYKNVAQNVEAKANEIPYSFLYFAGFNALSVSEQKILNYLMRIGKAKVYFDADHWYMNDREHEAGLFFRRIQSQWGKESFSFAGDFFSEGEKEIHVVSTPGNISIARTAGEILSGLGNDVSDTALVLADENLLLPVLNSLPENIQQVNITMGFPLRNSDMFALWMLIFELQDDYKAKSKSGNFRLYYRHFFKLIYHPVIREFLEGEAFQLERKIIDANRIFIDTKFLNEHAGERLKQIQFLLTPWKEIPKDPLACFSELNTVLRNYYLTKQHSKLALEHVFYFTKLNDNLISICSRYDYIKEAASLLQLIRQYVAQLDISFFGEPLEGLQLMGMLETRSLDFEKVILLSVNENTLPKSKIENTFILHEVKKLYGLPTYKEKDAVFANHFYRLLQRAKKIWLVYNSDQEALSGGEKSRFVQQLEFELPAINQQIKFNHYISKPSFKSASLHSVVVMKTPEMLEKIKAHLKSGISPSAINTYVNCPLDYYYRYILGLKEEKIVEEELDNSIVGTVIHAVLEEWFTPLIGKEVELEDYAKMKMSVDLKLSNQFNKEFGEGNTEEGMNHLVYRVAQQFLNRYLEDEIRELNELTERKLVLHLEEKLSRSTTLNVHGEDLPVTLSGTADRIESLSGIIRIIDFKTGTFDERDMKLQSVEQLNEKKSGKALQVLAYAWMFNGISGENCSAGIVPLKKSDTSLQLLSFSNNTLLTKEHFDAFERVLTHLFSELLDPQIPFAHKETSKFCKLC